MKNMNFKKYCEILKAKVLEFRQGREWDINEWNNSYIDFKQSISVCHKEYIESKSGEYLAIEWAREYYSPANLQTHDYEVMKKPGQCVMRGMS